MSSALLPSVQKMRRSARKEAKATFKQRLAKKAKARDLCRTIRRKRTAPGVKPRAESFCPFGVGNHPKNLS
jgi:hypothetical protein